MRGRRTVWSRTRRLEATSRDPRPGEIQAMAERIAAEVGTTPAQLLTDAAALAVRCRRVGARTPRHQAALIAAEVGCEPAEIVAEVERFRVVMRA